MYIMYFVYTTFFRRTISYVCNRFFMYTIFYVHNFLCMHSILYVHNFVCTHVCTQEAHVKYLHVRHSQNPP